MNPQSLLAVERRVTLHRTVGASWGLSLTCEGTQHVVEEIVEGSPGQKAGVLTGDNIIAIDGMNVVGRSHATLIKTLVGAGQTAVLQLNSQGYIIRNVTILKEPGTSFGMSLGDGKGRYQQVLAVKPGSPAADAGVQERDILLAVGGQSATNLMHSDVIKQLRAAGNSVELTLTIPEVHERWAKVANAPPPLEVYTPAPARASAPTSAPARAHAPATAPASATKKKKSPPHNRRLLGAGAPKSKPSNPTYPNLPAGKGGKKTPSPVQYRGRTNKTAATRTPLPKTRGDMDEKTATKATARKKTTTPPRGLRRLTSEFKAATRQAAAGFTDLAGRAAAAVSPSTAGTRNASSPKTPVNVGGGSSGSGGGTFRRGTGVDKASPYAGGAVDGKIPTIASWSPLHTAADGGRTAEVSALISAGGTGSDRGGVDILSDAIQRLTPLHRACQRGHHATVARLLEHGADQNALDHNNHTPLHWAAFGGCSKSVVELICHCAEVHTLDLCGQSPIEIAAAKGYFDIVTHLECAGAPAVSAGADRLPWAIKSFWAPNACADICMCCKITEFNMMSNWRHHCRWCGDVVCNGCTRKAKPPFLEDASGDNRHATELVCFTCVQKMHAFPANAANQEDAAVEAAAAAIGAVAADAVAAAKAAAGGPTMLSSGNGTFSPKLGGRHQHIRLLGQGAFGDTSLVMDSKTHMYRAQKEVRCRDLADANAAIKEATTMLPLSHPGLVQALDLWMSSDAKQRFTVNILMEYCNSKDLFVHMTQARRPIPEMNIVNMMVPLMQAVAYIHSEGVIHRDIKPANIFLNKPPGSKQLVAKLGDFGLAQKLKGRFAQSLAGTLVYMAPEQQRGLYDNKVDVWGLGATLAAVANRREMRVIITTKAQATSLPNVIPQATYSSGFIKAVATMLTYNPKERPSARKMLLVEPFKSAAARLKARQQTSPKKKGARE